MGTPTWHVSGQYYETCNCDFICPCIPGQLAVRPTRGDCQFAMAFQIERGSYGSVPLDGLAFVVLGYTPEEMGKGHWSVGLITDASATTEQREAMTAIASGAAGGPMAALSGLIEKFCSRMRYGSFFGWASSAATSSGCSTASSGRSSSARLKRGKG